MNKRILAGVAIVAAAAAYGAWTVLSGPGDAVPGAGAPIVQVSVPELTGDAKEGEALFNANCASCHGRNAAGQEGVAPPFVHVIYVPNHHSDEAFYVAAERGARAHHWPFGDMPPVKGASQDDVTKIIAYVRAIQRANGIY